MARTREFDTDQAIEAIAEQFWAGGYEATGIADLVEATGVGRASLYGAFGSKHDMLLKAIDFYLVERIEKMVEPVEAGGLDAATSIFRQFAFIRETMPERAQMGCLMVNTSVELSSSDPEVAALAERFRNRHRRAFRTALTKAVESGEIVGPIEERVDIATMLVLGLFVAIRGAAPLEEVKRLSDAAVSVVQSWRVPAAS